MRLSTTEGRQWIALVMAGAAVGEQDKWGGEGNRAIMTTSQALSIMTAVKWQKKKMRKI